MKQKLIIFCFVRRVNGGLINACDSLSDMYILQSVLTTDPASSLSSVQYHKSISHQADAMQTEHYTHVWVRESTRGKQISRNTARTSDIFDYKLISFDLKVV